MTYFACEPRATESLGQPAVNLYQSDNDVRLEAELPGLAKEQVKVEIKDGALEISAEAPKADMAGYRVLRRERLGEGLKRRFQIGEGLDTEKVSAKLENGLLVVTIPKREEAKPKSIEIS